MNILGLFGNLIGDYKILKKKILKNWYLILQLNISPKCY